MKFVILPSARDDLADGFGFYERQQEGLGSYFLESLFSDIDSLQLYAGLHVKMFGFHRLLSRRFPYAVYYDQDSQTVRIWAVLIAGAIQKQSNKDSPNCANAVGVEC